MDLTFTVNQKKLNIRAVAVLIQDGHLLIHRQGEDDFWSLPGGRVQFGESGAKAIERELLEELGRSIEPPIFRFLHENFFHYADHQFHELGMFYEVTCREPLPLLKEDFYGPEGEGLTYRFVPFEDLEHYTLYPSELSEMLRANAFPTLLTNDI
ncbi:NUDIX domain-containing protein [Exiguobacterium sp. SL14]|nr:NUDIX domain-containing protein [Exiguobacterium sp. SL14]MCY1691611.1 NUDIX domain-containing protein [Exiguobacterium sp. SL14]